MSHPAAFTILAPEFGASMQILKRYPEYPTAEHVAAHWLNMLRNGNQHKSVKVYACDAAIDPYEPLGMPLIDHLIAWSSSISSGNVYSNVQFSQMLPPRSRLEVNGFKALDGRTIQPSDLFERSLSLFTHAIRKSMGSGYAQGLELAVRRASQGVDADTGITVYNFQHKRTNADGLLPHGYLVITDQGKLLAKHCTGESPYSERLLGAATKILTYERTNDRLLFDYQGGQEIYASAKVKEIAAQSYQSRDEEADDPVTSPAPGQ